MTTEVKDLKLSLLLKEIDKKREIMISTALANGFTSAETIACSQELDVLITQYQEWVMIGDRHKKMYDTFNSLCTFLINPISSSKRHREI